MKRWILLALLASVATGQTAGDSVRVYTLDECIAVALRDNPTLAREQKNIEIGQSALTRAFGAYLPSLSASAGYWRQLNVEGGRAVNIGGQVFVLGTQPTLTHVPPMGSPLLTMSAFWRRSFAFVAAANAAAPPRSAMERRCS